MTSIAINAYPKADGALYVCPCGDKMHRISTTGNEIIDHRWDCVGGHRWQQIQISWVTWAWTELS